MRIIGKVFLYIEKVWNHIIKEYLKSKFAKCGKGVYLGNNGIATYENIVVGDHVYIGSNYVFQSAHGKIMIGSHVMFGPGVHIHGGNHVYDQVGRYMDSIVKQEGSDPTVQIEDDVWIGANSIIIGGVKIGFGSIVGAGSVVTHDLDPCGVYAGNPAKLIKMRFTENEINEHKELLSHSEENVNE